MPPSRHIQLTEQEDDQLREIEHNPRLKPKVRLRAQVLRLSNRGLNLGRIASHTDRGKASIARDLEGWAERGVEGLADGSAPGNPPRITQKMRWYTEERLSEERAWNATQLSEALKGEFSVSVTPGAVRQHLVPVGYSWKRTRRGPAKEPDAEEGREAGEELERLKKGPRRASWR